MYEIVVIPGDGIGKEVMEAALTVLKALPDIEFNFTFADFQKQEQLFLMKQSSLQKTQTPVSLAQLVKQLQML